MPPPPWTWQFGRAAKGILGSGGGTSRTDAAAAQCVPSLPPDLLAEILARVPRDVAFLFRCALVCKRWRRLLADPAFLRRLFPDAGRSSSLLGFFVQRRSRPSATTWRTVANIFNFKSRVPAFVPAPGSALGPRRRFLTSFLSAAAAGSGLLDNAEPLAERGGLVLLRVFPRAAAAGSKMFSLCVCSLLTGKLDVLPPLDAACFDGEGVRGYAVLPSGDLGPLPQQPADGYSNLCQVLLVGVHSEGKQLNVRSFSTAATASQDWLIGTAYSFSGDAGSFSGPFGSNVATVYCDTANWLFQLNDPTTGPTMFTVDVTVSTGEVCAYILDIPVDWSNTGRFHLLYQKHNSLLVRTVQGRSEMLLATMCVAEKSDTALVFLSSYPGEAYLLDLQSKLITTVLAGWSESYNYKTAVPYEINWPELFMSRLGVQQ
ncbi:unnamed protein product [Urochloa humidicola]